jgi:hypothetical protein
MGIYFSFRQGIVNLGKKPPHYFTTDKAAYPVGGRRISGVFQTQITGVLAVKVLRREGEKMDCIQCWGEDEQSKTAAQKGAKEGQGG